MTRRPDPTETRARELALAAGVDPDERIAKPGSARGMPAWCDYRDAARAEQNKRAVPNCILYKATQETIPVSINRMEKLKCAKGK